MIIEPNDCLCVLCRGTNYEAIWDIVNPLIFIGFCAIAFRVWTHKPKPKRRRSSAKSGSSTKSGTSAKSEENEPAATISSEANAEVEVKTEPKEE